MLNDYEKSPTPDERCVSWKRIAIINMGTGACLPMYFIVSSIALSIGFIPAVMTSLFSSIILSLIAALAGYIGAKTRISTYMLIYISFGRRGGRFINFLIFLTFLGWFSVSLNFFAETMSAFFLEQFDIVLNNGIWIIFGALLVSASAIFGFKAVDIISLISVPLIVLLLYSMIFPSFEQRSIMEIITSKGNGDLSFGKALSLFVGSFIVGATTMPDITRYNRTSRDGIIGCICGFIGGQFLIAIPCIFVATAFQSDDFINIMISYSTIMATIILATAMWSNNDNNLYASTLSLSVVLRKIKRIHIVFFVITLGIILASMNFIKIIIPFISVLSMVVPAVAGIYITDYFLRREKYSTYIKPNCINIYALCCWLVSSLVACLTYFDILQITTIPALDGFLISVILYLSCGTFVKKKYI